MVSCSYKYGCIYFKLSTGYEMNLSALATPELRDLQQKIIIELMRRAHADRAAARQQIQTILQSVGISLQDLMGAGVLVTKPSKKVEAKYRNPSDANQEWTGRGRMPKWLKAMIEAGASLGSLKI
jgi:DNA-binding protein H-NS